MRGDIIKICEAYNSIVNRDNVYAADGDIFSLPNGKKVVYRTEEYEEDDDRWTSHTLDDAETGKTFAVLQSGGGIESRGPATKAEIQKRLDNIDMSKMKMNGIFYPSL